jgi:hypothetical protein
MDGNYAQTEADQAKTLVLENPEIMNKKEKIRSQQLHSCQQLVALSPTSCGAYLGTKGADMEKMRAVTLNRNGAAACLLVQC